MLHWNVGFESSNPTPTPPQIVQNMQLRPEAGARSPLNRRGAGLPGDAIYQSLSWRVGPAHPLGQQSRGQGIVLVQRVSPGLYSVSPEDTWEMRREERHSFRANWLLRTWRK